MVALDVPDHGGAPGRLLAAQVAGVHAVLVGHEAVDERVEVGGGVARRRDRGVVVCKSDGNCMGKSVKMMRNRVKIVGHPPPICLCAAVASRNPVSRTVEKERNSDFEYLKIFYFFRTFLRYNVDNNIKIRCELGKTSFRSFSWLLSNHFFIFTGFKNTGQPKGCMEITSAIRAIQAISSYKSN